MPEDLDDDGVDSEALAVKLPVKPVLAGPLISAEFQALIEREVKKLPDDANWHVAAVAYAKGQGAEKRMGVAFVTKKEGIFTDRDSLSIKLAGEKPVEGKFGWQAELVYAL